MAKASYPKTTKERAHLYLQCMVEIKERLNITNAILQSDLGALFVHEICCLQYRHICELIAIACLAAQGDFQTQRAFRDEYNPAKIFNALRGLYPNFFPQPSTITTSAGHHHLDANSKPDAYREADITKLWSMCGDDLHRTSVTKFLKKAAKAPPPVKVHQRHMTGLVRLLETHVIAIQSSKDRVLLDVRLRDEEDNVIANFMTIDAEKLAIQIETYRAKLTGR